ncbi:heavy-metal-associated domain-containing protein [Arthrobacter roseus]|uniref:heavy-metal-associated domain-containing protein n=1 Tax=Arthrobacter roseus TaxID=136274 RepID=UPI00196232CE|nr:heavy-metal-associated domain-containing protein [Arthrobacter roseus]MBM7847058.1 copper ion binding protein [Arthrobacter roseus]
MNTTINITGMTCGHCVASVTEELTEIDGVENVEINLNKGGASSTVITSSRDLSSDEINDAVTEAGYQVVTENA